MLRCLHSVKPTEIKHSFIKNASWANFAFGEKNFYAPQYFGICKGKKILLKTSL